MLFVFEFAQWTSPTLYIICLLLFHLIFLNDNCSINCSWTSTADWIQSITILKIRIITFLLLECRARSSKVWLCLKVKVLSRRFLGLAWSETLLKHFDKPSKCSSHPKGRPLLMLNRNNLNLIRPLFRMFSVHCSGSWATEWKRFSILQKKVFAKTPSAKKNLKSFSVCYYKVNNSLSNLFLFSSFNRVEAEQPQANQLNQASLTFWSSSIKPACLFVFINNACLPFRLHQ